MNPLSDHRPPLTPPQFHLRTLLLGVTLCGLVFATIQWLSPAAFFGLLFLVLCIAAHVAGNSIGTKLRANGDLPIPPQASFSERFAPVPRDELPAATQLSLHNGLGLPQVIATVTGLVLGALGGGIGAALLSRHWDDSIIALGIVAFGTLGGIFAFVGYSFTQVFWSAYLQAQRPPEIASAWPADADKSEAPKA
jgi:hypothetical protein